MFADIIIEDRSDRPVALVDVKASVVSPEILQEHISQLNHSHPSILFGILVDLENIYVLKRDVGTGTFAPLVNLSAKEILQHYSPEFAGKDSRYGSIQTFHDLLETLVTAWLRDLAYHWKSEHPPGTEEFSSTGLLELIEGGFARRNELVNQPDAWSI